MSKGTVAVVGAGLIGANWANLFASCGYDVTLFDQEPGCVDRAVAQARQASAGTCTVTAADDIASAVTGAVLIQENIAEICDVKSEILAEIDQLCPPDALICSSTSTIEPDALFSKLARPERALIAHPFNPPHILRLVELVPSRKSSNRFLESARNFYLGLGMEPIVLKKSIPGFIGNRLQAAVLTEALRLVGEGVISPADLDTAMKSAIGPRWALMGPFETFDLGARDGFRSFCEKIGPAFQALGPTFDLASPWPEGAIDEVEKWRRSILPKREIARRQEQRDACLEEVLKVAEKMSATFHDI